MTTSTMSSPNDFMRKTRQFSLRVLNFVRPKPRYMPLSVNQVLQGKESLDVVNRFNDFYYSSGTAGDLNWRGLPMIKNPCDLWMIVDLFQKLRPTVIIETGTHHGASATYYADMLQLLGIPCDILTLDLNPKWSYDPATKNIHSFVGFSTDAKIAAQVKAKVAEIQKKRPGHVMVMLDSDHSEENVTAEIALYADLVTKGSYLIVEDTNVNGHPSAPTHGPGPYEAVEKFLATTRNFERDLSCQRYLLTYNPGGWLKRVL